MNQFLNRLLMFTLAISIGHGPGVFAAPIDNIDAHSDVQAQIFENDDPTADNFFSGFRWHPQKISPVDISSHKDTETGGDNLSHVLSQTAATKEHHAELLPAEDDNTDGRPVFWHTEDPKSSSLSPIGLSEPQDIQTLPSMYLEDPEETITHMFEGHEHQPAEGLTYMVTTGADQAYEPVPGSLRAAIEAANLSAATPEEPFVIQFDMHRIGKKPIMISASLPQIKAPVFIDGFANEEDLTRRRIRVVIKNAGKVSQGLVLSGSAHHSTIRGLSIVGFERAAVALYSSANKLYANDIGIIPGEESVCPNGNGIIIYSGEDNLIGGVSRPYQNVISANKEYQLIVSSSNNMIGLNYIGTDASARVIKGGGQWAHDGMLIRGNANKVGLANQEDVSVIAGHRYGMVINGNGNFICKCHIGTDVDGGVNLGNCVGILLRGGGNNTIGSTNGRYRNTLSGNTTNIMLVLSSYNTIQGNLIGTDATGGQALPGSFLEPHFTDERANPKLFGVVLLCSKHNTIGGTKRGASNTISGNDISGIVSCFSQSNTIQGNNIGPDVRGMAPMNYQFFGVIVLAPKGLPKGASETPKVMKTFSRWLFSMIFPRSESPINKTSSQIGMSNRSAPFKSRLESAISRSIPAAFDMLYPNLALSELIYDVNDKSATRDVDELIECIPQVIKLLVASSQTVGSGIEDEDVCSDVVFRKTQYGEDEEEIEEAQHQINLLETRDILIGGNEPGAANIISGNYISGIALFGAQNIHIIGNIIGTDMTRANPLPNGIGVGINAGSSENIIASNTIGYNTTAGISTHHRSRMNSILSNSIFCNGQRGISIAPGREILHPPTITEATSCGSLLVVSGLFKDEAKPNSRIRIEFFGNKIHHGTLTEGAHLIDAIIVKTDEEGVADFDRVNLRYAPDEIDFVSATATLVGNDTLLATYDTSNYSPNTHVRKCQT